MSPARRILVLCPSNFVSGAEHSTLSLLQAIDRTRYVPLLATPAGSPLTGRAARAGIETVGLPDTPLRRGAPLRSAFKLIGLSRAVGSLIDRTGPQLVHAATTPAALAAGVPAGRRDIPLVWHVRDMVRPGPLLKALARRVDATVAISKTVALAVDDVLPSAKASTLIYNGIAADDVSVDRPREAVRQEFAVERGAPLVVTVGQLIEWKRIDRVVELFAGLVDRHPAAKLLVVGADPSGGSSGYARQLKVTIDRMNLTGHIVLTGFRRDAPSLVAAADAFVSAARCEPLGRAVMEAMWLGTPVVVSAEGGHLELVEPDRSGLVFDAEDAEAGARQLLRVLEDSELARRLTDAARKCIEESFSAEAAARSTMALYDRLLRAEGPA